jgi:hypothetical protein
MIKSVDVVPLRIFGAFVYVYMERDYRRMRKQDHKFHNGREEKKNGTEAKGPETKL